MNQTQANLRHPPQPTDPPLIRRAGEPDAEELAAMLAGLTDLSLYFRFQTAIGRPVRPSIVLRMLCPTGAAWVATRDSAIVGHAMWAWAAGGCEPTAELAVIISEAEQRRGLGVRMVSTAAAHAAAAGATRFLFVVSAANELTIRMIRRRWPAAEVERDGALLNFLVPAGSANQPEERADVGDEQVRSLERREVAAAGELGPVNDAVPAI